MIRHLMFAATALALASGAPALAAPCKDAKGKFMKCPTTAAAKPATRCKLNGKFAKCTTPGAKPV